MSEILDKVPTPGAIKATCAEYFGKYIAKRGTWSPPNRCGSCPIANPCRAHGGRIARSNEELEDSRRTFHSEALVILAGRGAK